MTTETSAEQVAAESTAFTLARERYGAELEEALSPVQAVISADSHIIEPADLWTSRIDAAYRERGPHIEMQAEMPTGEVEEGQFMVVDGGTPQRVAGFAVANVDPKDRAEANKRGYEQIRPGAWDPVERLKGPGYRRDRLRGHLPLNGDALLLAARHGAAAGRLQRLQRLDGRVLFARPEAPGRSRDDLAR